MRNFREVAYGNMKKGLLYRSDVLYRTTKEEKDLLKNKCHIKTIIDFRNGEEIDKLHDSKIPGIKNINMPFLPEEENGRRKEPKVVIVKGLEMPDLPYYYRELASLSVKHIWTKLFDILLNNKDGAILYHCSAGKDRTGVATAVILKTLGIDEETIYQDYLLTNQNPLYYKKIAQKMPPEIREIFLDFFQAKKEYLDATFDEINKIYGSFDEFLYQCCSLNEEKISRLKDIYLQR